MSNTIIVDGANGGNSAKVDGERRLHTFATTADLSVKAALREAAYTVQTQIVNLTTDTDSFLIYIKNEQSTSVVAQQLVVSLGASDGVGEAELIYSLDPSGGDLLNIAPTIIPTNINFGSTKALQGVFRGGDQAYQVTTGPIARILIPEAPTVYTRLRAVIIPSGRAIAIGVKPPAGNTSMKVQLESALYKLGEEDI